MADRSRAAADFFENLRSKGISDRKLETLHRWDSARLFDLVSWCSGSLPHAREAAGSLFEFVVNDQLSGIPAPCTGPCRIEKATELAQFAALYADHVVIRDPFDRYFPVDVVQDAEGKRRSVGPKRSVLRRAKWPPAAIDGLRRDLEVLFLMEPLLTNGLASFSRSQQHFCPICVYMVQQQGALHDFVSDSEARRWQRKVGSMVEYLLHAFEKRTEAHAEKDGSTFSLDLSGDTALIEHGSLLLERVSLPKGIQSVARKHRTKLSFDELRKTGVLNSFIEAIIDDIARQNYYANVGGFNYLTSRSVDFELINASEGRRARSRNRALFDGLTHSVPLLERVPVRVLLELRKKEGEAFIVYRDAVTAILNRSKSSTVSELREEFADSVRPEIDKIERSLKVARKVAVRSLANELMISAGTISVALFGGILPAEIGKIGAALGGFHGAKAVAAKVPSIFQEPKKVLDNKFYFLWRASRLGHKYAKAK